MASVQTLLSELATKLTPRARDELSRLIASPEAEALLARDEEKIVAERRLLVRRLAEVAGKFKQAQAAAGLRAEAAAKTLAGAEIALHAARDGFVAACAQSLAAQTGEADERQALECELRDGADARLETFAQHVESLSGVARHVLVATPVAKRSWVTGEKWTELVTNRTEVDAARNALMQAASTAREMRLQALDSRSITEWLQSTLVDLEPLLRPFRLDLLTLDENGNLARDKTLPNRVLANQAIRKAGGSTDVSDELPVYDRAPNLHRAQKALGLLA